MRWGGIGKGGETKGKDGEGNYLGKFREVLKGKENVGEEWGREIRMGRRVEEGGKGNG